MNDASPAILDNTSLARFIGYRGPHCLIIARHGETDWNAEGRMQGQLDTALNHTGQNQALEMARFLSAIPLSQVHCSTLRRCWSTALPVAEVNIGRPSVIRSDVLKEISLGVLEGELKERQSTASLSRHYRNFSADEFHYTVPDGESLSDVLFRVQHFFEGQHQLLQGQGIYLFLGHRNINRMVLKHLLGLSLEQGIQVEHEHQWLYFYFTELKEIWSCRLEDTIPLFKKGLPNHGQS